MIPNLWTNGCSCRALRITKKFWKCKREECDHIEWCLAMASSVCGPLIKDALLFSVNYSLEQIAESIAVSTKKTMANRQIYHFISVFIFFWPSSIVPFDILEDFCVDSDVRFFFIFDSLHLLFVPSVKLMGTLFFVHFTIMKLFLPLNTTKPNLLGLCVHSEKKFMK